MGVMILHVRACDVCVISYLNLWHVLRLLLLLLYVMFKAMGYNMHKNVPKFCIPVHIGRFYRRVRMRSVTDAFKWSKLLPALSYCVGSYSLCVFQP